ncbi:MAG: tetraacyldisaccharide 4'-kinase [Candidatus Thiodiazotropha sp. (ex Lucina aurantia)]|nr:tetraacyldisaccharide 4'-kinase [Candidatus Thiodiazotropha taylori]MBV2098604.1 tetraacyldisaccharide 4'-kinase [Candidatus Thiodiazotropha sp. (ex Codakia orbicularis)]MBV2103621.1 tetraacyldisaccharide 4'-kinase [Candidatus Thiodiazotropha sp. (ex Lucina aurantia)]MBV2117855.1 tetraacyldisaccharide 4'-kinase [Candidatus Thiodiazotropha sp. (ex Lucina aurantia)]
MSEEGRRLNAIEASWRGWSGLTLLLLPLSGIFCLVSAIRRLFFRIGLLSSVSLEVPVIVVGNITVGGTGKTPLVIWLAKKLQQWGYKPGIVTRGYGGGSDRWPCEVNQNTSAKQVGDEAVLLKRRSGCPVYAGPDRPAAARQLLTDHQCDLIISDDGLQHYALARDLEIVVIDGERWFGNGLCLPAGPLRERRVRLAEADLVIVNGASKGCEYRMHLKATDAVALDHRGESKALIQFKNDRMHAIAGIGYPDRFFNMLEGLGLKLERHPFPDHHAFTPDDLKPFSSQTVLMTEKDAVKCELFAQPSHWYVPVVADVDNGFEEALMTLTKRLKDGQKTA